MESHMGMPAAPNEFMETRMGKEGNHRLGNEKSKVLAWSEYIHVCAHVKG
jgi:hypothetical protein